MKLFHRRVHRRAPRRHHRWALAGVAALSAVLAACGPSKQEGAGGGFPASLHWAPRPQAGTYRVQAWSDLRLLFEESVSDTALALTPSLLRAMAPFDSCRIEVRIADDTREPPQVFWVRKEP